MKKLCTIVLLMLTTVLSAQVDIPDPVLSNILLSSPDINTDDNDEISYAEAEAYTGILDLCCGVSDVTGLEAFVNITGLDFSDVSSFPEIDLSYYPNLTLFNMMNNEEITSLDFSSNPLLTTVLCPLNTGLTELNVSENPLLSSLTSTFSDVTSVDLSNKTMELVDLQSCELSTVNVQNSSFGILGLYHNNLSDVDFSGISVETLTLSNNQFLELDLSETSNLLNFHCGNNPDLTYVNLQNGFDEVFNSSFVGLPNLEAICVDNLTTELLAEISVDFISEVVVTDNCAIDLGLFNEVYGNVSFDMDDNGCSPGMAVPTVMVHSTDGVDSYASFSQADNSYLLKLYTNNDDFTTSILGLPDYFTVSPSPAISSFVDFGNTEQIDFCLTAEEDVNDLNVSLIPSSPAIPGFEASYTLVYSNAGNTVISGEINLDFSGDLMDFVSASETLLVETENTLSFAFVDMNPFETASIELVFQMMEPPVTSIEDVLNYTVEITPVSGDYTPEDNAYELNQQMVGSWDPNDISVAEGPQVLIGDADNYLHYRIRFQNTGTAPAVNIKVENELDELLDWNTFQYISSSHDNRIEIVDGNDVSFIFDNINLVDSFANEPDSHGYIIYKIKPVAGVVLGNVVENQAAIYFDFNEPIITNVATTEFVQLITVSVPEFGALDYTIYPVPTTDILNINSPTPIVQIELMNELGQLLISEKNVSRIDLSKLSKGLYFVKATDVNGNTGIQKMIKQ